MSRQKSSLAKYLPIAAVTIIGAALRFYRLDAGMWYDELFCVQHYFKYSPLDVIKNANNHALYTFLAQFSMLLFGESESAMRLPAALMGIATIPLLYYFAARFASKSAALPAALLIAFSMWHIWFSQEARGYSGMILFCLLSQYYYLRLIEAPTRALVAGYVLSIAAASFVQPFSIFVFLSYVIIIVGIDRLRLQSKNRSAIAAIAIAAAAIALLYLPSVWDMLHLASTEGRNKAGRETDVWFMLLLPFDLAGWKDKPLMGAAMLLFALIGIGASAKKRPLIAIVGFAPLFLALLAMRIFGFISYYRYVGFFMPWYFMFTALGVVTVGEITAKKMETPTQKAWLYTFISALAIVVLLGLGTKPLYDYYKLGKQPLKEVAKWTDALSPQIPVYSFGLTEAEFTYYSKRAKMIPHTQSIEPYLSGGGIFVGAFPFSWHKSDTEVLLRRCGKHEYPAAGYKNNTVYVFTCPGD